MESANKGVLLRIAGFVLVAVSMLWSLFAFKTGEEGGLPTRVMLVAGAVIYFAGAWQARSSRKMK
jgi:hypothetical protein